MLELSRGGALAQTSAEVNCWASTFDCYVPLSWQVLWDALRWQFYYHY